MPNDTDPQSASANPACCVSTARHAAHHKCPFGALAHFTVGERSWCAFHLPLETDEGEPTPKATWTDEEVNDLMLKPLGALLQEATKASSKLDLSFVHFPRMLLLRDLPKSESEERPFHSIRFDRAVFHKEVFFQLNFGFDVSFMHTRFKARADFRRSQFAFAVFFMHATFDDIAQFMNVPFAGSVNLVQATFKKSADFTDATFGDEVSINGASFGGNFVFHATGPKSQAKGITRLHAQRVQFQSEAKFSNRDFFGETNFRDSTFALAPDFHGCALHHATYFPGSSGFLDVASPLAASRYRTLFHGMGSVRAHDDEAMFFALQQRTLRRSLKWHDPLRLVSWIYDAASGYGQSIARPLLMLLAAQLVFGSAYLLLGAIHLNSVDRALGPASAFTWQQVFRPFAVWLDPIDRWPRSKLADVSAAWPFVLATAHTLFSALCISFLALGTRWRFRRW